MTKRWGTRCRLIRKRWTPTSACDDPWHSGIGSDRRRRTVRSHPKHETGLKLEQILIADDTEPFGNTSVLQEAAFVAAHSRTEISSSTPSYQAPRGESWKFPQYGPRCAFAAFTICASRVRRSSSLGPIAGFAARSASLRSLIAASSPMNPRPTTALISSISCVCPSF